jgi:hypothetical protein
MKNTIKLSLVAAVAVSTLSAGSLSDAIKDTSIKGKAMVGYNYSDNGTDTTNETEYDFDMTITTKVNDTISFTGGVQADHAIDIDASENTDMLAADKITLTKLYFTAKTDAATVMIGKQKQPTPFLDDDRGDGVVVVAPMGSVTLAAGHFTGMNADKKAATPLLGDDITAAAVIGSFGAVNGSLWLANVSGVADAYSLNLAGKFGPVSVDARHSSADYGDMGAGTATLSKIVVSGKAANVGLVVGYATTNSENTAGYGVDITADADAKTNFAIDQTSLDGHDNSDALLLGASTTYGKTTYGVKYLMADIVTADVTELNIDAKYAMSKNFSITALYSSQTVDSVTAGVADVDTTNMELSLNYSF